MHVKFFLTAVKAQWAELKVAAEYCWAGDNNGGGMAVLQPTRSQYTGIQIQLGLIVSTHTVGNMYNQSWLVQKFDLHQMFWNITTV